MNSPESWPEILWKYFPENLLIRRFTLISCLGAPTRHLLMLHTLFQLSFMVMSQERKNIFLAKLSRKLPDSCPDILSIRGKQTM